MNRLSWSSAYDRIRKSLGISYMSLDMTPTFPIYIEEGTEVPNIRKVQVTANSFIIIDSPPDICPTFPYVTLEAIVVGADWLKENLTPEEIAILARERMNT